MTVTAPAAVVAGSGRGVLAAHETGAALVRWLALLLGAAALALAALLWQRLGGMQQQLARQSAESLARSSEALERARDAQQLLRESAAHLALLEARVSEVFVQRAQLESLLTTLSHSRDDTLVIDLESTLRFAQQQAQLTGSAGPLIAALKSAAQRIDRSAQPRLTAAREAIGQDLDALTTAKLTDTTQLAARIDDLLRLADELPLANAVGLRPPERLPGPATASDGAAAASWWDRALDSIAQESGKLLRVTRIDQPESALLSPSQGFFVRENLKLLLHTARLGLFARQFDAARTDLAVAETLLRKYFDASARQTRFAVGLIQQLRAQANAVELPQLEHSLAALAAAAR